MSISVHDNTPSLIRDSMLNWYDHHARVLPWRSKPDERPDPYHVWMSEVMLQQTTVPAVMKYFEKFITLWPTIDDLANASQEDVLKEWAGLGYYSRARNLHKCAKAIVEDYQGLFPDDTKTLKGLPGVGDYTAAAMCSIAFDTPSVVIDGNIERVISRLYKIETPLPDSKPEIREYAQPLFVGENTNRPSCFAQSLMDLGAAICTPKSPKCDMCPIKPYCTATITQAPEQYPRRKKKTKIPEKHAIAYIYLNEGKIGIETRPDKGMLGGMVGFPTSEWIDSKETLPDIPFLKTSKIRHVFTHFSLTLYPIIIHDKCDRMVEIEKIDNIGLPTLFKKLWNMIKSEA